MERKEGSWKRFQRLRFNARHVSEHMQRAESVTTKHARKFIFQRLNNIRDARREIMLWLIIVGVMIGTVVLQLAWFGGNYLTTTAAAGGTYSEASRGPIKTLNPLYATTDAELSASRLLFSSLYSYDTTGHLTSDLAIKTDANEDGTVYTVTLRSDAMWHDDVKLTAKDVAFTINLIKNPNTRAPLAVNWRDVNVKALDDDTVQFTLPAAYAAFTHALTFPVLPEHILKDVGPGVLRQNGFSGNPVGSGPFRFVLMRNDEGSDDDRVVHLSVNKSYYKGQPKLEHFDIHALNDTNEITRALQTGEVNAAASLDPDSASRVTKNPFRDIARPIDSGVYALFNTKNDILSSPEVRIALRAAIDTDALRQSIPGKPNELYLPFFKGQIGDTNDIAAPKFDRKKAGDLLTAAGWKLDGKTRVKDGRPLKLTLTTIKNTTYQHVAKNIVDSWKAVGVQADVNVIDTQQPNSPFVQNILQPRNFDVLLYELEIGADPDVYAYWSSTQTGSDGYNFTGYNNGLADANLTSARAISNLAQRNLKYHAFAEQWLKDAPAVGLYQAVASYVASRDTTSIDPDATLVRPEDRFANVLYWSVGDKIVYKTP